MAKAKASLIDRVARAKRIRTNPALNWTAFTQPWTAFNHLYVGHHGATEEERVMSCIREHLDAISATGVLERAAASVEQVLELPPGNMRIDEHDAQFRARSTQHAAIVNDETQAHLTAILYQVRNNLVHGDKDPVSPRDRRLVRACAGILDELLPALESCIEKRAPLI